MNVVVDGLMTHYEKVGSGPVVLALHGWGDSLETFESLTSKLKQKYTIVRVDLPGFGKTELPKETFTLQRYADFVQRFIDKTNITPQVIIGHSNGGAIAIKGIGTGVLKTEKLVLIASAGVRNTYNGRKKALRVAAKTAKAPTKVLPKSMQEKLKRKAYSAVGSEMFVAENMQETFKEIVSEDVIELSKSISTPTLLIYGSKDEATPVAYGEAFCASMLDATLQIIAGAGHFVHHSHADEVESAVQEFLA